MIDNGGGLSKIPLAIVITLIVTTGAMVYRAGVLANSVDQLTVEVDVIRTAQVQLRSRVDALDLVAATAVERWRHYLTPDQLSPTRKMQ